MQKKIHLFIHLTEKKTLLVDFFLVSEGHHVLVVTDLQDRLALVQKVAEEHQQYQSQVHDFQTWLVIKTEEVSCFTEIEDVSENQLQALQVLKPT